MMIGFGVDLCDIRRIENTLERFGDRFIQRCFTKTERAGAGTGPLRASSFAKRFAAKEACAKALGTGIAQGVTWRDIGVINAPSGHPLLRLGGAAAIRLAGMTPKGFVALTHLSLTDEYPLAMAQVIIEITPEALAVHLHELMRDKLDFNRVD